MLRRDFRSLTAGRRLPVAALVGEGPDPFDLYPATWAGEDCGVMYDPCADHDCSGQADPRCDAEGGHDAT